MSGTISTILAHSRTVLSTLVLILVAGSITYATIPKEAEPDIDIPVIYVSMKHDGISPEDAERLLVRPMEQELRSLEGLKEMKANAYEGGANVTLEFEAGTVDTDQALLDVREKVDAAKTKLPQETEDPSVNEVKISKQDPMLVLNISGSIPERMLVKIAKDLKDKIEGITGVLEVDLYGDREELLEVVVDPLTIESYGLAPEDIYPIFSRNNQLVAAGSLNNTLGQAPVKVPGVFENPEDVLDLPLKTRGDRVVRFRDVASVRRTYKDATSYARIDGQPAVGLEVVKRAGSNIIATVEEVRATVAEESEYWPEGVQVTYSRDKSDDIRNMLTDLQNNVLSAVLLVVVVIIGILGVRTASLVGIAIPGSFLAGILWLGATGITVNIVVLFSLIMAVGMLVDGAIVVTEYADRKMAEGMDRKHAYATASQRMGWPIITSTITTLAAFAPLVFWPGIVGQFMGYLPITLIATLASSLVMALIFVPTLGSIYGKAGAMSDLTRERLAAAENGNIRAVGGFTGKYIDVLESALKHPGKILSFSTVALIAIFIAYGQFGRGTEFFPNVEPEVAWVNVYARGDLSTDEKDSLVREVENRILDMKEFESVYTRVGSSGGGGGGNNREDQVGRISLQLVDWELRRPAEEILEEVRDRTDDLPGIEVETTTPNAGPTQGKPIQLQLSSRFPEDLNQTADRVREIMTDVEGLRDIEDSRPLPGIEWRMKVDRAKAARFGADVATVGGVVQFVTNGIKVGEYRPDDSDDEIDIRVRFPSEERNLDQLDMLRIPTQQGNVPISNFVVREPGEKVGTIKRTDMRRTVTIMADHAPDTLASELVNELRTKLQDAEGLSPRVQFSFKGEDEEQQKAAAFLMKAFGVALFVIAIVLVTQFNSFYQAFLILTAIIFSTGGVFLGHLLMNKPFGIVMSGIGVIALAGIVVNNNIVLIDTYNVLRNSGMPAMEAVLRTGAQRLRPVLLTTVTTILGLLPMVLGINIDLIGRDITIGGPSTQWWIQLASAVAGGLFFATVLTLIVTPSLLMLQANHEDRKRARERHRMAEAEHLVEQAEGS
ncbi:MAG: efflux RND transporter permease subunit [Gammaproteobacteria bacterium]|nr:efflux RND transporter permease subunit [Gammaproteobacteria bacterium]